MDGLVIRFIEMGGYWGIAFLMALENIFPPIPSELIMGIGGISVARGNMDIVPLLIAGTIGATLGNYVLFLAGDRLGYERLHPLIDRWGRWLTMTWEDVEGAGRFFRKHGQWVVFLMRFMPLFRTIVSIPAGLAHMNHVQFLTYTALGSAIWNIALIKAGEWLGGQFAEAEKWLGWATVAVAVGALAWYLWRVIRWRPAN
ncbi:alkaline phosphatase [Novosphingobium sp. PC22D]|uniref:DedA family protein n=1 Tax=Novosphingobium sp. PC22D TaxID=1962403 RepID=UPI000BF06D77|nr:DedA family protein [Novosphingobium sp. PC22D]PEQ11216.1 alkaline phosphatase [Novosphingobium sp. PC22D]